MRKEDITRRNFLKRATGAVAGSAVLPFVVGSPVQSDAGGASPGGAARGHDAVARLKLVTYCGLYCGLCAQRARIPRQASALRESMAKEGYEFWAKEIPGFSEFWTFLTRLCDREKSCPGCRQGGGYPLCSIRKCAHQRQVDVCVFCKDYPCKRVLTLAERYPILLADGKRMKKIGIAAWTQEQKERAKAGFVYADIRCQVREPSTK